MLITVWLVFVAIATLYTVFYCDFHSRRFDMYVSVRLVFASSLLAIHLMHDDVFVLALRTVHFFLRREWCHSALHYHPFMLLQLVVSCQAIASELASYIVLS
jgi:hypothetical protein